MPLARISMRRGKSAAYRKAILEGLYQAMRETFDVPERDRFMTSPNMTKTISFMTRTISASSAATISFYIQLTVSNTRSIAQKQNLYRRIVEKLTANPGLRPEDIFINLVEVLPANWSFGHGEAQYVQ